MIKAPLPLVLTMGEPAGIGADITLKAWLASRDSIPAFFVIDDPVRLELIAKKLALNVPIARITTPKEAMNVFHKALPVFPLSQPVKASPGHLNPIYGHMVMESIETAVRLTMKGLADAIVTNPIHKYCLQQAGFSFPGHTEYLAELTGVNKQQAVMMLICSQLRVIPVTIHISIAEVVRTLNSSMIIKTAHTAVTALRQDFGIMSPRLVIAGLNPHAGENSTMGHEDIKIITPAVQQLRKDGLNVRGPLSADTLFHPRARVTYDVALCMYHDQALIPIKTIGFDEGVNITLGLPIIRTSPDHGTAIDLAGSGRAKETSLIAALRTASNMASFRACRR